MSSRSVPKRSTSWFFLTLATMHSAIQNLCSTGQQDRCTLQRASAVQQDRCTLQRASAVKVKELETCSWPWHYNTITSTLGHVSAVKSSPPNPSTNKSASILTRLRSKVRYLALSLDLDTNKITSTSGHVSAVKSSSLNPRPTWTPTRVRLNSDTSPQ